MVKVLHTVALMALSFASQGQAADLVLPQGKGAFYADEAIELAVAGLARDATATIELLPQGDRGLGPVSLHVRGDGSTVTVVLPPLTLAPGKYAVTLDGRQSSSGFVVSTGVNNSTMLLSQTGSAEDVKPLGGNFFLGNAFVFGRVGPDGMPSQDLRGRSTGLDAFDRAVALDLPTVVYMYWTGYVTHKPWGTRKGWAEQTMSDTMRMFSLHTAQRLRRYSRNVAGLGTIDEPGLGPGKTPAGTWASGYANWDSAPWYERRGWTFTNDPASRPDADWLKYASIRGGIIGAQQLQARDDLKRVWPNLVFSTDNYAAHAVMDGAEPMNQAANDIPATHVFLDWGVGRLGAIAGIFIEKSHNPTAPVALAMNGQLAGGPIPSAVQRDCYRGMLNSMLAAGLKSNWWLNWSQISREHLKEVNEPAVRVGPLFAAMRPTGHDVAVLWSQSEIIMRCKDVVGREARQKEGEPIKLTVSGLPENSAVRGPTEMEVSPNTVGGNYRDQVISAYLALNRAGFPAHVLHEKVLSSGVLKHYKVVVIVGQTTELPAESRTAIAGFVAAGGQVVADKTTTIRIPGSIVTAADFQDPAYRWTPLYLLSEREPRRFATAREASYFQTNAFMDEPTRAATRPIREAMRQTKAAPILTTESVHLMGERHLGGEGALYMVLNAHDRLPEIAPDQRYMMWNYAPYEATYSLNGLAPGSAVYRIEGTDWSRVARVADYDKPQTAQFEACEMKLYLVAPRNPEGLDAQAQAAGGVLRVEAGLKNLKMPWPITVTISSPDGKDRYRVYRATDVEGRYAESFPVGSNAAPGAYTIRVESPVGGLSARVKVDVARTAPRTELVAGVARVFDPGAIRSFFQGKPDVVIALGGDRYQAQAAKLAAALNARGLKVRVADERQVFHRHTYPRVFDPYLKVYTPAAGAKTPAGLKVETEVKLQMTRDGRVSATLADGTDLGETWRERPYLLATVTGEGYIDYNAADGEEMVEPGCKIYVDGERHTTVVLGRRTELKATPEARSKWSRPWTRLAPYSGAFNLTPQLPEAYESDQHLILLGDSRTSTLIAALQASDLLTQVADTRYPGPGKALVSYAWSPFGLEKDVILIGASDDAGVQAGIDALAAMAD